MKAILCLALMVVTVVYGAEEKKTEKRGLYGLGYGLAAPAPVISHGLASPLVSPLASPLLSHAPLFGPSVAAPLVPHGPILGPSVAAPLLSHAPVFSHGVAAPLPLAYSSPLLGVGHGWH